MREIRGTGNEKERRQRHTKVKKNLEEKKKRWQIKKFTMISLRRNGEG